MTIDLPWPPRELSPNARIHWAAKARAAKRYKRDCGFLLLPHRAALAGKTRFKVSFLAPNARRRDTDNCIAAFKAGNDALAEIAGVDDSKFEITYARGEIRKGGAVLVGVLE